MSVLKDTEDYRLHVGDLPDTPARRILGYVLKEAESNKMKLSEVTTVGVSILANVLLIAPREWIPKIRADMTRDLFSILDDVEAHRRETLQ
jgi:hypothetical protein